MSRRLHLLAALAAVVAATLLSGCSDEEPGAESSASALLQTGLDQLSEGSTAAARGTFENVLVLDPDNQYALYNLGLIAQADGDEDEARARYDAALAADPDYAPALYNRAILDERTDLAAAIATYRRVLEIDPDLAAAHMRLGFALLHLGQTAEAEASLARGVALDPAMAEIEAPSYE
ncbi:tetratricopeptide repeat protein [Nocardioides humi]|uniref:Tetratricopeptide repeat protein n=1 Tax=Nocardioides humi TaxID=449461 RepID=A0ABN2ACM7_9ACTN|nr:tetratricopeptide repeat protein [Nocardioides humi]